MSTQSSQAIIFILTLTGSVILTKGISSQTTIGDEALRNCYLSENGGCSICYRSILDPKTKNCGPTLPESDPCDYYVFSIFQKRSVCGLFKEGYTEDDSPYQKKKCYKSKKPIKDCYAQENLGTNQDICVICKDGFPVNNLTQCRRFSKFTQKIPQAENCLFGTQGPKSVPNSFGCQICKQGFTADIRSGLCRTGGPQGCRIYDFSTEKCLGCDVERGWSMQLDGNCTVLH